MVVRNLQRVGPLAGAALCALTLLAFGADGAQADVIYVDVAGGGDHLTIQEGLDAAAEGDTVLVAQGIYSGSSNVGLDFHGVNKILRSESGPALTLIDCSGSVGSRGLYFHSGEDTTSVVEGFTITNAEVYDLGGALYCGSGSSPKIVDCEFVGNVAMAGGALFSWDTCRPRITGCMFRENGNGACIARNAVFTDCEFVDQSSSNNSAVQGENLRFSHCMFESNHCSSDYGGAANCEGSCVFEHCRFVQNSSHGGGAIYATGTVSAVCCTFDLNHADWHGGAVMVTDGSFAGNDCLFTDNSVWEHEFEGYGGAVYCGSEGVSITDCSFFGNSARGRGGALALYDCFGAVSGCVVAENLGTIYEWTPKGGGLYTQLPSADPLTIDQCTFAYNGVQSGTAGGIYCLGNYGPTITRSIVAFSTEGVGLFCNVAVPTVTHCCVYGNAGGDSLCGNYYDNLFLDPEFCDAASRDFTVHEGSPCLPAYNPWGEQIGARGSGCEPSAGTPGLAAFVSLTIGPASPNPSLGTTEIAYQVRAPGVPLEVSIYNVGGQVVRILHDGPAPAARGALVWDGADASGDRVGSGTYFCVARSGGESARQKLVLVR